jgi:hypothetical protein
VTAPMIAAVTADVAKRAPGTEPASRSRRLAESRAPPIA